MNINFTPFCPQALKISNNKIQNSPINFNRLENDVFTKTTNINFTSLIKPKMSEIYLPFEKDALNYILKNDKYDIKKLEEILQKYSPFLEVKNFSDIPKNINPPEYSLAYTQDMANFEIDECAQKLKGVQGGRILYLKLPQGKITQNDKLLLADNFLHEATHIFQAETSDSVNLIDFLNKHLAKEPDINKALQTLKLQQNLFNSLQGIMLKVYSYIYKKADNLPKENKLGTKKELNEQFQKITGADCKTSAKNLIKNALDNLTLQGVDANKKMLLDFIALKAQYEKQAYTHALNAVKKEMNITSITDLDARIEIYNALAQAVESLG